MEDIQVIEKAIKESKFVGFLYHGKRRIVAPYRLEQIKGGALVLRGLPENATGMRSFRLDEIGNPELVEKMFNHADFISENGDKSGTSLKKILGNILGIFKRK